MLLVTLGKIFVQLEQLVQGAAITLTKNAAMD
jgi:hypothetical protein